MTSHSIPEPKRILVIPLRFIGDTILTVPLLRNLRHQFPNAHLDVWLSKTAAPLLEPCPLVDGVVLEPKSAAAQLKLLRENQYDTVFILRKSVTTALLCRMAGVRTLVGYDKQRLMPPLNYKRWGWLLDVTARYPSLRTDVPQPLSHLGLLSACGISVRDNHLELWATPADESKLETVLRDCGADPARPWAALHTVSASMGKSVEPVKFADSLHHLHNRGFQIFCTGTARDEKSYEELASLTGLPLVNLAGKTSLRETFTLYRKLQVLLTVDSSPIHLGAAAGVPNIVGVFGPTNERQWGPHNRNCHFEPVFLDLPCRPCYAKTCEHEGCRTWMSGEHILAGVKKALSPA